LSGQTIIVKIYLLSLRLINIWRRKYDAVHYLDKYFVFKRSIKFLFDKLDDQNVESILRIKKKEEWTWLKSIYISPVWPIVHLRKMTGRRLLISFYLVMIYHHIQSLESSLQCWRCEVTVQSAEHTGVFLDGMCAYSNWSVVNVDIYEDCQAQFDFIQYTREDCDENQLIWSIHDDLTIILEIHHSHYFKNPAVDVLQILNLFELVKCISVQIKRCVIMHLKSSTIFSSSSIVFLFVYWNKQFVKC
jgi:hypothetical protein